MYQFLIRYITIPAIVHRTSSSAVSTVGFGTLKCLDISLTELHSSLFVSLAMPVLSGKGFTLSEHPLSATFYDLKYQVF